MDGLEVAGLMVLLFVVAVGLSWAGRRLWWHSPATLAVAGSRASATEPPAASAAVAHEPGTGGRGWLPALVLLVAVVALVRRRRGRARRKRG
jgi:hypothetical protein